MTVRLTDKIASLRTFCVFVGHRSSTDVTRQLVKQLISGCIVYTILRGLPYG